MQKFRFFTIKLLLLFNLFSSLFAEEVSDPDFGYSLDIPEGFQVAEYTPDGMSYRFQHENAPVSLLLKIYTNDKASDVKESFLDTMSKLKASYDGDLITWRNVPCVVSQFEMTLPGNRELSSGWGISATLPGKNASLVLLCYCPQSSFKGWQQFILSTLNSLCIDQGSFTNPGLITSYAYPSEERIPVTLKIASTQIATTIGKEDIEAGKFVIDMEYSVLTLYANHSLWQEAWKRYYRMIYRDAAGRLKKTSRDIYLSLYPDCEKINRENPLSAMNEFLLNWVQYMPYARDNKDSKNSDFTDLVSTLLSEGSDCDSRSLLVCALLRNMGLDTCLFISREYSHAIYGIKSEGEGAKIEVNDTWYLLNETTAKDIKPGLISKDLSDSLKWIAVTLW